MYYCFEIYSNFNSTAVVEMKQKPLHKKQPSPFALSYNKTNSLFTFCFMIMT